MRRWLVIVALFLMTSCAGYIKKTASVIDSYEARDFDHAIAQLSKIKPKSKDRLLYALDQGMIFHAAGKYEESIEAFARAAHISEELYKSLASGALSIVTNENVRTYVGAPYERLLIPIWQALNYASLGKLDEALVEVRRFHTIYTSLYGHKRPPESLANPFNEYLSATVWEGNGLLNDAYIDYRAVYELAPHFPYLKHDLLPLAQKLGFREDVRKWQSVFKSLPENDPISSTTGELIFILEAGLSPRRFSSEWMNPELLQVFPVPQYEERPTRTDHVDLYVEGKKVGETQSLASLTSIAMATLKKELPALTARTVARTVIKEGAAIAVGETVDRDLGFLLGLLVLGTNQVDLRHWRTLPDTLQIARVTLPAGKISLTIKPITSAGNESGKSEILETIEIQPGKKTYLPYRIVE